MNFLEELISACESNLIDDEIFDIANEGFLSKIFSKKEKVIYDNSKKAFDALIGKARENKVEILKSSTEVNKLKEILKTYNNKPGKVNTSESKIHVFNGYPVIISNGIKNDGSDKPIKITFTYIVKNPTNGNPVTDVWTATVKKI